MDPELQAQISHIVALLNELDRKIEALDRKLDNLADQVGAELDD